MKCTTHYIFSKVSYFKVLIWQPQTSINTAG